MTPAELSSMSDADLVAAIARWREQAEEFEEQADDASVELHRRQPRPPDRIPDVDESLRALMPGVGSLASVLRAAADRTEGLHGDLGCARLAGHVGHCATDPTDAAMADVRDQAKRVRAFGDDAAAREAEQIRQSSERNP